MNPSEKFFRDRICPQKQKHWTAETKTLVHRNTAEQPQKHLRNAAGTPAETPQKQTKQKTKQIIR